MSHESLSPTSLADTIAAFSRASAAHAPADVLATAFDEITKLVESGIARNALHIGQEAPTFTLPDARGGEVSLASLLAKGAVALTFYRGGWCPFCDLQLRAYQGVLGRIRDLGAELVAVSPQTPDFAAADVTAKELTFPVLSDRGNVVARSYGLVFPLTEQMRGVQTRFGSVLPKFNGDASWELPMPATFVVARGGNIVFAHTDANYTKRVEPAALLAAIAETTQA